MGDFPGEILLLRYTSVLFFRASLAILLSAAVIPSLAATVHKTAHSTKTSYTHGTHRSHRHHVSRRSHRVRGQQAIQPERVTEIQQALIREHYFTGDADGKWDSDTQAAMRKFQADQGWQTKLVPDSRALKKLGLGADYSQAINAKGSTFADPPPVSSIPAPQAAGFAESSGTDHEK